MIYLDSSALIKLVRPEAETVLLEQFLSDNTNILHVASELVVTELRRALIRLDATSEQHATADQLLEQITLLGINRRVLDYAAKVPFKHLRSLDAIHLAAALRLRSSLTALVTYDKRLAASAAEAGAIVETPGTLKRGLSPV